MIFVKKKLRDRKFGPLKFNWKKLRSQQNFYAAAGRTGRDKYHLWTDDQQNGK